MPFIDVETLVGLKLLSHRLKDLGDIAGMIKNAPANGLDIERLKQRIRADCDEKQAEAMIVLLDKLRP